MSNIIFGLRTDTHPSPIPPGNNFHFYYGFLFRIFFNYLKHEIAIAWVYKLCFCLVPQWPQLSTVNTYPFGLVEIIVNALGPTTD
jgi:hypothetical protein